MYWPTVTWRHDVCVYMYLPTVTWRHDVYVYMHCPTVTWRHDVYVYMHCQSVTWRHDVYVYMYCPTVTWRHVKLTQLPNINRSLFSFFSSSLLSFLSPFQSFRRCQMSLSCAWHTSTNSGNSGSKFQPTFWLSWLVAYLGHGWLLPNPFQLTVRPSSYTERLSYWQP